MKALFLTEVPSRFGQIRLVWTRIAGVARLLRILLCTGTSDILKIYDGKLLENNNGEGCIENVVQEIKRFLLGEDVRFNLECVNLGICSDFQRAVLLAEYRIPRSSVSTYGRLAGQLGVSKAYRAVGNSLAGNPFPIIIPCHRVVRSDGGLGGYQGGAGMKRVLLEMEGIEFLQSGKVDMRQVYY